MTLAEHFREFRRRLFVAALAIVLASIGAAVFYDQIFAALTARWDEVRKAKAA